MRDGEGVPFVVPVLLIGAVEGLEERLLLVLGVLVGLRLRQVLDGAVGHGGLARGGNGPWMSSAGRSCGDLIPSTGRVRLQRPDPPRPEDAPQRLGVPSA